MAQTLFFAYKYVLIAAMICQIEHYAPRMHLPIETPVRRDDIRVLKISPPVVLKDFQDYGGRIQVRDYDFIFAPKYLDIYKMDEHGFHSLGVPMSRDDSANSGMERASQMKYVVTTNELYGMASNWIAALDFDVAKLEAAYPPRVNPYPLFRSIRGWVPSPLLVVYWSPPKLDNDLRTVYVSVSAVTGELLTLSTGRNSFSKRKAPINDLVELLAKSDEEFLKYTAQDRRQLLEKFAGVKDERDFRTKIPPASYGKLFGPSVKPKGKMP